MLHYSMITANTACVQATVLMTSCQITVNRGRRMRSRTLDNAGSYVAYLSSNASHARKLYSAVYTAGLAW